MEAGLPPFAAPTGRCLGGTDPAPSEGPGPWCRRLPSPVGAAEAVALAGGEVGLVDGLDVGLGVGGRPALRCHGTDSAAAERGAGQTPPKNQPATSPFGAKGAPPIYTSSGHGLTVPLHRGLFKWQWLIARVTREATSSCFGAATQSLSTAGCTGASSPAPAQRH